MGDNHIGAHALLTYREGGIGKGLSVDHGGLERGGEPVSVARRGPLRFYLDHLTPGWRGRPLCSRKECHGPSQRGQIGPERPELGRKVLMRKRHMHGSGSVRFHTP